jgi:hypothetical protein
MTTSLREALLALRGFLRGFVGATDVGGDAHGVRCELARRAERRRGCC